MRSKRCRVCLTKKAGTVAPGAARTTSARQARLEVLRPMLAKRESWLQTSSTSDTAASVAMHAGRISAEVAAIEEEICSITDAEHAAESPGVKIQELEAGASRQEEEQVR